MSSLTSTVGREFQTGLLIQEVSLEREEGGGGRRRGGRGGRILSCCNYHTDARGFPFPVDQPYGVDPHTGYPTPKVCSQERKSTLDIKFLLSHSHTQTYAFTHAHMFACTCTHTLPIGLC